MILLKAFLRGFLFVTFSFFLLVQCSSYPPRIASASNDEVSHPSGRFDHGIVTPTANNSLPLSNPVNLLVTLNYSVSSHEGELILPLLLDTYYQKTRVVDSTVPLHSLLKDFEGNLYARLQNVSASSVAITLGITLYSVDGNIDVENVGNITSLSDSFIDYYTASDPTFWPSYHPRIQDLASDLTTAEHDLYNKVRRLYDYVVNNIAYTPSPRFGALDTLDSGTGDSDTMTDLFVSLSRSLWVPTRSIIGWHLDSFEDDRTVISGSRIDGEYVWSEFFLPNYSWIPVDPVGRHFASMPASPPPRPEVNLAICAHGDLSAGASLGDSSSLTFWSSMFNPSTVEIKVVDTLPDFADIPVDMCDPWREFNPKKAWLKVHGVSFSQGNILVHLESYENFTRSDHSSLVVHAYIYDENWQIRGDFSGSLSETRTGNFTLAIPANMVLAGTYRAVVTVQDVYWRNCAHHYVSSEFWVEGYARKEANDAAVALRAAFSHLVQSVRVRRDDSPYTVIALADIHRTSATPSVSYYLPRPYTPFIRNMNDSETIALVIEANLKLHSATGYGDYLDEAQELGPKLVSLQREDGTFPTGSSVCVSALSHLHTVTQNETYLESIEKAYDGVIARYSDIRAKVDYYVATGNLAALKDAVRRGEDLLARQDPDGSWDTYVSTLAWLRLNNLGSTTDSAWSLMKLFEATGKSTFLKAAQAAAEWLLAHQNVDGGWAQQSGTHFQRHQSGPKWTYPVIEILSSLSLLNGTKLEADPVGLAVDKVYAEKTLANVGDSVMVKIHMRYQNLYNQSSARAFLNVSEVGSVATNSSGWAHVTLSKNILGAFTFEIYGVSGIVSGSGRAYLQSTANRSLTITWTGVIIDKIGVSDERCDVGATQTIRMHAVWSHNGSDIDAGRMLVNGTEHVTNRTGWIIFPQSFSSAVNCTWVVEAVDCAGVTAFLQTAPSPSVIWDRIKIAGGGVSTTHATAIHTGTVWYSAVYEFDGQTFNQSTGAIYVNESAMAWSPANERWEYNYTFDTPGTRTFKVSAVSENQYGLTAINDLVGNLPVTWKEFKVVSQGTTYTIPIMASSTISDFAFSDSFNKQINFTVSGPAGTTGAASITIPNELAPRGYDLQVYIGKELHPFTLDENATCHFLFLNYSHSSRHIAVRIVDTFPPVVSIASPSLGFVTNSSSVTVVWNGSDVGSGIDRYKVKMDEGSWMEVGNDTSYTFGNLAEGSHTVRVEVVERAGNSTKTSAAFIVDTTTPYFVVTSPSNGATLRSSMATVTWAGQDVTSGISHYEVRMDGGPWGDVGAVTEHAFDGVEDGIHSVEVKAVDRAGNSNEREVIFTVNTSFIGEPGWTDDLMALGAAISLTVAITIFFLLRGRRHRREAVASNHGDERAR